MLHITEYFKKFAHLAPPEKIVREAVQRSVLSRTGVEVRPEAIRLSQSNIFIIEHPTIKNEIFMQKSAILSDLKTSLGNKAPRDVR